MDPLDHRNVFVRQSAINNTGEGMFARRTILPDEVVVMYAGLRVPDESGLYTANMTEFEREDAHKNLMSMYDEYSINIPPSYTSTLVYRASLGHKVRNKCLSSNVGHVLIKLFNRPITSLTATSILTL
jgi:hypothetical protein